MNTLSDAFLEEVDRAIDREAPIDTQIDQAIDTYLGLVTGDPDLMATFASPALGEPPWSRCATGSSATPS